MRFYLLFTSLIIFLIGACEDSAPEVFEVSITVAPEEAGEVIPSTSLRVEKGQELYLLAMPTEAYSFSGWTGAMDGTDNPMSIVVNSDLQLTADFQVKTYPLTVNTIGRGAVAETIIQAKTTYDHGTMVQLSPVPEANWEFSHWVGDVESEEEQITVTVTEEMTIVAVFVFQAIDPVPVQKTNDTKLYMHYMPWYTSGPFDGSWSQSWRMNNRDPENIVDGKREIASHFYPLIGPYSSHDPDLAEYHLLLMKYAGIDAVMIDWYGTYDVFDYRDNLDGSNTLIDKVDDVGISFGIVYEDRTTPNVVNAGLASTQIEAATTDWNYIFTNYFSSPNYVRVDSKPLAMVFTPIEIETGSAWTSILANSPEDMLFLSIWGESRDLGAAGDGEYSWVFNGAGNHIQLLQNFYNGINSATLRVGSAYPGFVDFYEEGGRGDIIGWEILHNGTQTLEQTLNLATQYQLEHLQIVTWNDFGEGTMVEPTVEFGFSHLEAIQDFAGVSYGLAELQMIHRLYELRKEHAGNANIQDQLNQVFYLLVSLQVQEASDLIAEVEAGTADG